MIDGRRHGLGISPAVCADSSPAGRTGLTHAPGEAVMAELATWVPRMSTAAPGVNSPRPYPT